VDDLFSLREAAKVLGLSPDTLRVDIHRGNVNARKFGNSWVIDGAELDRQLIRRGKPPRDKA
jgi:excisionase family DNA binding protein